MNYVATQICTWVGTLFTWAVKLFTLRTKLVIDYVATRNRMWVTKLFTVCQVCSFGPSSTRENGGGFVRRRKGMARGSGSDVA